MKTVKLECHSWLSVGTSKQLKCDSSGKGPHCTRIIHSGTVSQNKTVYVLEQVKENKLTHSPTLHKIHVSSSAADKYGKRHEEFC